MTDHVLGVFDTPAAAAIAVDRLMEAGVPENQVSVVMSDRYREDYRLGADLDDDDMESENKSGEGAATGFTVGGVLGALAGGLAATGAVVATGGTVLVAGPIAAALAGAGAGGASGGIIGGLLGLGVPKDDAETIETALDRDEGMVVGVTMADGAMKHEVKQILKDCGGRGVSVH